MGSSFTTRAIASDNINYSARSAASDTLLEINPSVRLTRKTARLSLDAAYTPRYYYYADDTFDSRLANDFNLNGRAEVVDDLLFMDARVVSAQRNQSVFNAVPTDAALASNQVGATRTYSITPSLRGTVRLGDVASWRSSYNVVRSESTGALANTLTSESFSGTLSGAPARVQWQADVTSVSTSSDRYRGTDRKSIVGSLNYRHDPALTFTLRYGYEDTNLSSSGGAGGPSRQGDVHGYGFRWTPDVRTQIRADVDQRVYARTNTINISHRLPRTAFNGSYTRTLTNRAQQILAPAGTVDLFDQLSLLEPFASIADPVERERLMEAELVARGLSRFIVGLSPVLSDNEFLLSRWQGSVTRTGARNSLTLSVFRTISDSTVGSAATNPADDFSRSAVITQRGWTMSYNHKVSSLSSLNLSLTSSKSSGVSTSGLSSNRDVLNATWTTRLGGYTTGSIGLRMTRATVSRGDVDENAVIATLSTRFN